MITELILKFFLTPVGIIVKLIPSPVYTVINSIDIPQIVKHGAYFFPLDCLAAAISSFLIWYNATFIWSLVEWVYKKIPGID